MQRTPLLVAAVFNLLKIAVLLHERGAKLDLPDKQGITPLIAAAQRTLPNANYIA